ncbi:MAG: hypothetical protein O7B29_02260 [Deltaproteobacteria bacterium]|nr:hypothetical protein [Deltaproteobacteria bacterium]
MRNRPVAGPKPSCRLLLRLALCGAFALLPGPSGAGAHEQDHAIAGQKLQIKANGTPSKRKASFKVKRQNSINLLHNPATEGVTILIAGTGANAGRTELITLDPKLWKTIGDPDFPKGYRYKDKQGSRGGITKVLLKPGKLSISARGPNWTWTPSGVQDDVWVYFRIEQETFCARFGGTIKKNEAGLFQSRDADSPGVCPDQVCGNKILESGEECDDGNLLEDDGCNNDCMMGACSGQEFASTFEGIQSVVFDGYGCNSTLCHDTEAPQGSLILSDANTSFSSTVGVLSFGSLLDRVEPGEQDLSFLYTKLAAATLGTPTEGSPMPVGGALTVDHLEALKVWIRGGAPRDLVVAGTAELLQGCLPEPDPLTIPKPDPPGANVGVQFQQTPWPLPSQFEDEICMATYYDLTVSNLVPAWAKLPCPGVFGANNPSGECFYWHGQTLYQDPQSHHSIIHIYTGESGPNHSGWGSYTFKFQDPSDPAEGTACDPTDVDPNMGYNPNCSSAFPSTVACIGFGPPDYGQFNNTAPTFSGSQEPFSQQNFADGVYGVLPMAGVIVWNSHAFNLTSGDSTLSQYVNMEFADPNHQLWPAQAIFDTASIFVPNVPPFETREYCRTYTLPQGAELFSLASHTHRHGVQFRTWAPPNTPCVPGQPACVPKGSAPIYFSTQYSDPMQLKFDPPIAQSGSTANRSYLYCSLYDNGATPTSPAVKRQSTSPSPPLPFVPDGPCADSKVACLDGPQKGQLCGGSDSSCDSFPGAGDGVCDACPVRGGVTTEDEMFILIGSYYLP